MMFSSVLAFCQSENGWEIPMVGATENYKRDGFQQLKDMKNMRILKKTYKFVWIPIVFMDA